MNQENQTTGRSPSGAASCSPSSGIEAAVCEDIAKRQRIGIQKYGVTVADNPLDLHDWLQHAYEECLDQAVYLKRAMMEAAALLCSCQVQNTTLWRGENLDVPSCPKCGKMRNHSPQNDPAMASADTQTPKDNGQS